MPGDYLLLGGAGKMGPSLARMVGRAATQAQLASNVYVVSRFTNSAVRQELEQAGIKTLAGDLFDEQFLSELPDTENVIFMTGRKFGTKERPSASWAMNTVLPARICPRFRDRRILAFSTGNVYPYVDPGGPWSRESDPPQPVSEYGMSALGRERVFQYFSEEFETPVTIVRLNYAVEMRYGVLADLACQVLAQEPIDLTMGYANVIWQADANSMALAAMADARPGGMLVNIAGEALLDVRQTAEALGDLMDRQVTFTGSPQPKALLSDGSVARLRYGPERVDLPTLTRWVARWIATGRPTWTKPTHFQQIDGQF